MQPSVLKASDNGKMLDQIWGKVRRWKHWVMLAEFPNHPSHKTKKTGLSDLM